MSDEQNIKARARKAAQSAPKADPDIAEAALRDAKSARAERASRKEQKATVMGKNVHHDVDNIISEFDDPAAHTYKDGER